MTAKDPPPPLTGVELSGHLGVYSCFPEPTKQPPVPTVPPMSGGPLLLPHWLPYGFTADALDSTGAPY